MAAELIKLGINVPLTGCAASYGESALSGAKLAAAKINKAGGFDGRKLELVVYDDQASPKESVAIGTKLIEKDKVAVGFSCSYSGATRSATCVCRAVKVPSISAYAIHPDLTRAGDYVSRTSFVGEVQGRAGAKLAGEILHKKRAVLITLRSGAADAGYWSCPDRGSRAAHYR